MNPNQPSRQEAISDEPWRIAFVVHGLDPGGIERFVTTLCNSLPRDQYAPSIICLAHSGKAAAWLRRDDVPVIELKKRRGNDPRLLVRLAQTLRRLKPTVVQSHNWGTLVETTIARRMAKVPTHVHAERGTVLGRLESHGWRMRARALVMRRCLDSSDAVVTNAHAVARRVESACEFAARRITVIPNGVPTPCQHLHAESRFRIRSQLGIRPNDLAIGTVGRLVPVKGFDVAIDAFRRVHKSYRQTHLIIVGDGPEKPALAQYLRGLGMAEHIHLVGHQADVSQWLAAMDIYINTSRSEGMSQAILEAMAAGLPMVVTDVGDNAILVGGSDSCGSIVPADDPSELAKHLIELVADAGKRHTFSENSRARHASSYTLDSMLVAYDRFYRRLIERTGHALSAART